MTVRLQVLIDTTQRERLEQESAARGVSVGSLVRTAIDLAYPPVAPERARAAAIILGADPSASPDLDALLTELEELRGSRR